MVLPDKNETTNSIDVVECLWIRLISCLSLISLICEMKAIITNEKKLTALKEYFLLCSRALFSIRNYYVHNHMGRRCIRSTHICHVTSFNIDNVRSLIKSIFAWTKVTRHFVEFSVRFCIMKKQTKEHIYVNKRKILLFFLLRIGSKLSTWSGNNLSKITLKKRVSEFIKCARCFLSNVIWWNIAESKPTEMKFIDRKVRALIVLNDNWSTGNRQLIREACPFEMSDE